MRASCMNEPVAGAAGKARGHVIDWPRHCQPVCNLLTVLLLSVLVQTKPSN